MTIEEYADILNAELVIRRYDNQENRYSADFEHCEIMEDGMLVSSYGNGKTPDEAIESYVQNIRGKRIAFNASNSLRREFVVPKNLTGRINK